MGHFLYGDIGDSRWLSPMGAMLLPPFVSVFSLEK